MTDRPHTSDLLDLLHQDNVSLRRSGPETYTALCPFHSERKPSFQVRISKRGYWEFKCWSQSCGVRGGAKAYRELTHRPPPERPERRQAKTEPAYDLPSPELLTLAANHYNDQLLRHDEAAAYLVGRGVDPEQAALWGIGYAPGNTLYRQLQDKLDPKALERCPLVNARNRHDRLARRVIIPDYRPDGASDWHTGRAIDPDAELPYLSVPGPRPPLLRLRQRLRDTVMLVEGPFDLVAALAAGYHGAATAGNPHPSRLRSAIRAGSYRQALVLPDRDEAGDKWADIVADACRQADTTVRILTLPDYCQDPADALRHRSPGVKATIATAVRLAFTGPAPVSYRPNAEL